MKTIDTERNIKKRGAPASHSSKQIDTNSGTRWNAIEDVPKVGRLWKVIYVWVGLFVFFLAIGLGNWSLAILAPILTFTVVYLLSSRPTQKDYLLERGVLVINGSKRVDLTRFRACEMEPPTSPDRPPSVKLLPRGQFAFALDIYLPSDPIAASEVRDELYRLVIADVPRSRSSRYETVGKPHDAQITLVKTTDPIQVTRGGRTAGLGHALVCSGYLVEDGKVLLVHHKRFDKWVPPGGHIEAGDTFSDTARREFLEETGLEVEVLSTGPRLASDANATPEPVPFYVDIEREGFAIPALVQFFFVRRTGAAVITPQRAEVHAVRWFDAQELEPLRTFDQVRELAAWAIKNHPDSRAST